MLMVLSYLFCCCCQVFVHPESSAEDAGGGSTEGANAQFVAKNLVNLVNESKAGELASLEELVSSLVKDMLDKDNKDAALDPEVCTCIYLVFL